LIISPPINELTKKANKYTLVIEAAKRARQIVAGAPPLVDIDSKKEITIAANEIRDEKIVYFSLDSGSDDEG
jgi:DNA-directed RNA polymerase subunit omega